MAGTHKVDIVIEAQNNAKKVLDSIQKSIDNLTQSVARSQAVMAQNISRVAESVESLKESFGKISASAQQVSHDTKKIHYDWRGLVWTIVRAEIVFRGIMRIVNAIKDYFDSMLDTLDEYQMSLLQLSAIQTTLLQGTVKSKDELERLFNRMYSINQSVYQTLLKMSAQTPLTTEQLLRLYRAWLAYGQVVDLSNEKMRKGLLAVANAIYMMSGGFQVNRQLVQETRGLITQTSLAYSDLARFIIRSGIASKEQLQTWRDQNILLEKMADKLAGFVIASDRALETLQGLGTTLESVWKQKVIENFGRAYDSIRAFLKVVLQSQNILGVLSSVIHASATAFRIFAIAVLQAGKGIHYITLLVKNLLQTLWNLVKLPTMLPLFPILPPKWRSWWEKEFKESISNLEKGWKTLWNLPEEYSKTLEAIRHPEKFVTPTNVLDEQAKKFKDFYTLLQSFATSGSRIADEIDQNLAKIGDSFKENFGIKSLDAYVKAKDYINSLQKGIFSFIDAIAKKGKEAKLPQWDSFVKGLRDVAEGKLKLKIFVDGLKELAKTGRVSKDVLELMGQTTIAVSQKVDYLHKKQKELTETEKNITNLVLKETKDRLTNLEGSFKCLGAEIERFGIPATTLEAKLKNVDIRFASLQNKIVKSISDFKDLRDSIEKASKSTKVPEDLRIKLRALLPVLDKYIDKLKEWLRILPEKANKYKEYLRLIDKQRQELFKLREAQAKIEKQYKTARISVKEYYQSILENLLKQKQAYEERLKYLKKDSQEYISTEEKILQVEKKITDVQLELDKRSNKWREGLRRTLQQYKDSLEATVSAFSIASSTMTSALQGLENAFTAVFGDIMLNRLKSFHDYFMIFINALVAEVSKLLAKLLMLKVIIPAIEKALEKIFSIQIGRKKSTGSWVEDVASIFHTLSGVGQGASSLGTLGSISGVLGKAGNILGKIWKPIAIGGAIAGGLGVLGDIFGGLFGGGKHHPGKYGWTWKWGGIHIEPTGKVSVGRFETWRTLRAGEKVSQNLHNWFSEAVSNLMQNTGKQIEKILEQLPETKRSAVIDKISPVIDKINKEFAEVTYITQLEALRQQAPAVQNYIYTVFLPRLQQASAELMTVLEQAVKTATQTVARTAGVSISRGGEVSDLTLKLRKVSQDYAKDVLKAYTETLAKAEDVVRIYVGKSAKFGQPVYWRGPWKQFTQAEFQRLKKQYDLYGIPSDIINKMWDLRKKSLYQQYMQLSKMQHGGTIVGSQSGYYFGAIFHGTEHVIPESQMKGVKQELSEIKRIMWALLNTAGEQNKHTKRTHRILQKWDATGMPVGA